MSAITTDDLLEALAAAMGGSAVEDAHTMKEWTAGTGWGDERLRKAFRFLQEHNRLEVHQVRRTSLSGIINSVPAYRIKPK